MLFCDYKNHLKCVSGLLAVTSDSVYPGLTLSQSWLSQCGAQSLSPQGWMAKGLFSAEHWFSGTTRPSGALQYTWRTIFPWPHDPEHCNEQRSRPMSRYQAGAIEFSSQLSAAKLCRTQREVISGHLASWKIKKSACEAVFRQMLNNNTCQSLIFTAVKVVHQQHNSKTSLCYTEFIIKNYICD